MSFNISNYMDGVPVKISEKYKPPPKVSIPQAIVNRIALCTDDHYESPQYSYSFQLEKQVIRKLAEWKKVREVERENRRERIRKYELQKCRDIEERQKQLLTAVSYPSTEDLSSDDSVKEESHTDVAPHQSIQQTTALSDQNNHHPHQNFDTILQPIVANSYSSYSPSTVFNISKINYSDFENDTSSPFDNIELKTINDLDILAQVLNDTQKHSKQNDSEVIAADESKVQVAVDSNNQLAVDQSQSLVNSPSAIVGVGESKNVEEAATTTDMGNNQNQTSNFYYTTNTIPSDYQLIVNQTHSLHLQPQHHLSYHQQHQQQQQHQQYMLNYANMNHHNMESVNAADVYFNYNNLPAASNHAYLYRDYSATQQPPDTTVGLPPSAKYYPNGGGFVNNYCDSRYGLHSVDVVAAGNRLEAEMIPKSKSKSVPDILKELKDEIRDSEIRRTRNHSQTCDDQEKRNSSDSAQSPSSSPSVTQSLSSSASTSFMKLSPSSQALAKNISSMGFPLERVAKIAEMYGNDDKKIVEHLIGLSELLDLGFEESKISEALVKYDNNKDKALDFLIS